MNAAGGQASQSAARGGAQPFEGWRKASPDMMASMGPSASGVLGANAYTPIQSGGGPSFGSLMNQMPSQFGGSGGGVATNPYAPTPGISDAPPATQGNSQIPALAAMLTGQSPYVDAYAAQSNPRGVTPGISDAPMNNPTGVTPGISNAPAASLALQPRQWSTANGGGWL